MKIKFRNGDFLKAEEQYKVHQVNCRGRMDTGIAKQIKYQFPAVYQQYHNLFINADEDICKSYLGTIFPVVVEGQCIINLFGELECSQDNVRHTNYEAFYSGLEKLREYLYLMNSKSVAFPFKIGSGRGGGDWNVIIAMIISVFKHSNITIIFYKYDPKSIK